MVCTPLDDAGLSSPDTLDNSSAVDRPRHNESISSVFPWNGGGDGNWTLHSGERHRVKVSEVLEDIIYQGIVVGICAFGLLGNIVNMLVLSSKSLTRTMERMERSAHYGLMGLAVSDALLCVSVLPTAYVGNRVFGFYGYDFRIVYATYSHAVINTFILSSTWLTVTMAVSRYLAICYPIHARLFIGRRFAITSLVVVFGSCALLNIPRYFASEILSMPCQGGESFHMRMSGALVRNRALNQAYNWVYFIFGIFVPFLLLAFCNANLIRALHVSMRMRMQGLVTSGGNPTAANRITLTLIVIVAMYLFLVVPTETLAFFQETAAENVQYVDAYNLVLAILNMFQAANFAFNFLLYCAVNSHFRQTFWRMFMTLPCCKGQAYASYKLAGGSSTKFTATSRQDYYGRTTLETSTTL